LAPDNSYRGGVEISFDEERVEPAGIDVPIYAIDPLVRRSQPLQQTVQARAREDATPPRAKTRNA
jgi:hypothetical protein